MLTVTREMIMPTTITGSYPRPLWFDRSLAGRSFKSALGDSLFREQYLDAVACIITEQEAAGLDIVTDGDSRFDLTVGGKSWFFYPIERLGGIEGHRDTSRGWMSRHGLRPGKILWEVQEAYQPGVVRSKLTRGPLEYAALWQVAQRMTDRPLKFGAICAPAIASMLWNEFYDDDKAMILDLCEIMNAEFREIADAGCPLIQVEEPPHHMRAQQPDCTEADLEFLTEAFNRQLTGVNAEIWVHTCWGNPNQQRVHWNVPSYERALPHLLQLNCDVLTLECASTDGRDLKYLAQHRTDKKIAIGVVNHCNTVVEPAEHVAALIRKALEYIPPERLIISTDCGFGREGLSRRIAFYKCVALVEGTNIVRRELGLPEARVRAADPGSPRWLDHHGYSRGGEGMKIAAIDAGHYRIALPVPLSDSTHGTITHFELVTARVRDADGAEGVGYTVTPGAGGGAIHALIARDLAPGLMGEDADRIEGIWHRMFWTVHYAGRGGAMSFAMAAIDIALWDLKARRLGQPLWRLLGGFDPAVPCYAGGVDLDFPLQQLLRQTDDNLAKGFRAIKMKVGRPRLSEDVARVKAMRAHLGADFPLMVDANMRWSADEAIRAARALAECQLVWLEEPTVPDDIAGHARILREGGLPIATGENFHTLYEFQNFIAAGAVTFPEPDVSTCGGVTPFMKVCHLAEAANLPVTSHGMHDVTVHLLAAVPNRSYLEAHGFGLDRFIADPLVIRDGKAMAPERPGHGVAFDWRGLEALRV